MTLVETCVDALASNFCRSLQDDDLRRFGAQVGKHLRERRILPLRTACLMKIDGELLFHNDRHAYVWTRYDGIAQLTEVAFRMIEDRALWRDSDFLQLVHDHFKQLPHEVWADPHEMNDYLRHVGNFEKQIDAALPDETETSDDDEEGSHFESCGTPRAWFEFEYEDFYEMLPQLRSAFSDLLRYLAGRRPSLLMQALDIARMERAIHCFFVCFEDDPWMLVLKNSIREKGEW